MPISYPTSGYSFTPQFAQTGALQGLQPLDVTRGARFDVKPLSQIEIQSARPELVAQGIAKGIEAAVGGITSGITAKYKEEKDIEKEKRKQEFELLKEKEKQKTENLTFINQERVKLAATRGMESDYPEQDAALVAAGQRVMGVLPSGYTATKQTPKTTKTPPVRTPTAEEIALTDPALPVGSSSPSASGEFSDTTLTPQERQRRKSLAEYYRQFPEDQIPSAVATPATQPAPVIQPPQETPIQPVTPSLDTWTLPPADTSRISQPPPAPVLKGIQPVGAIPVQIPEQPQDVKAPRNIGNIRFNRNDAGNAYETAVKLSTPYREVKPQQDPQTKEWYLIQEDKSADVQKLQKEASQLSISWEDLALRQQAARRQAEKEEFEKIQNNKKSLKEDQVALANQKNNIQTAANKLDFIDRSIQKIESDPEIVGFMTQYYTGGKKIPFTPASYEDWAALAKSMGYNIPANKIQKILDIQEDLKVVQANLEWEGFQKLKELSTKGSAGVGGFTEGERESLGRVKGSMAITQSPENLIKNLYKLKNESVKLISDASREVKDIDPSFRMPITSSLKFNPNDEKRMIYLKKATDAATPQQRNDRNYLDAVEEYNMLVKRAAEIYKFNKEYGQLIQSEQ